MNSFTAIAAAVTSAANANASAGIFNYNNNSKSDKTKITSSQNRKFQHLEANECNGDSHKIGTNLADLSVCWHRTSMPDNCQFCGHPFYEGKNLNNGLKSKNI